MCLIVHRERGHLPNEIIDYNRKQNPDGFGLAWREGNKLISERFGPSEFETFRKLLKGIDKQSKVEYVAHFRRATHGKPCKDLAHPFRYADRRAGEVLVFHNGIIDIKTEPDESDTQTFTALVLAKMEPRWWTRPVYRYLIENVSGYNKFLLMTAQETIRLNENLWTKRGGLWYSTFPDPPKIVGKGKWTGKTYAWGDGAKVAPAVTQQLPASTPKLGTAGREGWWHQGHWVIPYGDGPLLADGEDHFGYAICSEQDCLKQGDYYMIEGKVYIEIPHILREDDDEETGMIARLKSGFLGA